MKKLNSNWLNFDESVSGFQDGFSMEMLEDTIRYIKKYGKSGIINDIPAAVGERMTVSIFSPFAPDTTEIHFDVQDGVWQPVAYFDAASRIGAIL